MLTQGHSYVFGLLPHLEADQSVPEGRERADRFRGQHLGVGRGVERLGGSKRCSKPGKRVARGIKLQHLGARGVGAGAASLTLSPLATDSTDHHILAQRWALVCKSRLRLVHAHNLAMDKTRRSQNTHAQSRVCVGFSAGDPCGTCAALETALRARECKAERGRVRQHVGGV